MKLVLLFCLVCSALFTVNAAYGDECKARCYAHGYIYSSISSRAPFCYANPCSHCYAVGSLYCIDDWVEGAACWFGKKACCCSNP